MNFTHYAFIYSLIFIISYGSPSKLSLRLLVCLSTITGATITITYIFEKYQDCASFANILKIIR
jgi:hypothetical protein